MRRRAKWRSMMTTSLRGSVSPRNWKRVRKSFLRLLDPWMASSQTQLLRVST
jgi:hypothetical protein